jgi:hypothetical protein
MDRETPHSPRPEPGSGNPQQSEGIDFSAEQMQEETVESRLIKLVNEKLATADDLEMRVIELRPGEEISSQEHPLRESFDDKAVIIIEGELDAYSDDEHHSFPRGYVVARPCLLSEKWNLKAADDKPTTLLRIPREALRKWFEEDYTFYNLSLSRIHEVFPRDRMPEVSRQQIRFARDQSLLAQTTRQGIDFVNRRGGLFEQLNPETISIHHHDTIGGRDRKIGPTEQIWQLVEAVSPVLNHLDESVIENYAEVARQMANRLRNGNDSDRVEVAMKWFRIEINGEKNRLFDHKMPQLSTLLQEEGFVQSSDEYSTVASRILQARALRYAVRKAQEEESGIATVEPLKRDLLNGQWDAALCDCYNGARDGRGAGMKALLEQIDETIETIFQDGRELELSRVVEVAVEKFQLSLDIEPDLSEALPADHSMHKELSDLQERLSNGDISAVGGSAYPRQRFPRVTLNQLAYDQIPVSVFDGNYDKGLADLRTAYGRHPVDPSLLQMATAVKLEGIYGQFDKSWMFFRDGASALLISHTGEGRQLSNASALKLFETRNGTTIPLENIRLARDVVPIGERVKIAVDQMLEAENEKTRGEMILGETILRPESIPTQVHLLQHPEMFHNILGSEGNFELTSITDPTLQRVYMGYWRKPDGEITRLILPTVGSRGLYGDTAGSFVEAVMDSDKLDRVLRHCFFHATAGGFSGTENLEAFQQLGLRGLPDDMHSGALIMPHGSISDSQGEYNFKNLLQYAAESGDETVAAEARRISEKLAALRLYHTDKHYCVGAPALETAGLIEEIIASGHASIDVESGPVIRALHNIQLKSGKPVTFTPIYLYSDDPRHGIEDVTKSLAFGAPLSEGSRPKTGLYSAFVDMMQLVHKLEALES